MYVYTYIYIYIYTYKHTLPQPAAGKRMFFELVAIILFDELVFFYSHWLLHSKAALLALRDLDHKHICVCIYIYIYIYTHIDRCISS